MPVLKGFIGPAYQLASVNIDAQICQNWFPEQDELGTGKNDEQWHFIPTPGLSLFASLGAGPHRGTWLASNGRVFAVSGPDLYEVFADGTSIVKGSLGTTVGNVSLSDNGVQLIVVDGTNGFILTFGSPDIWAQIVDADFPAGPDFVVFLDGYFLVNEHGTRKVWFSAINDGLSWDGLDIFEKEGSPDNVVGLLVDHGELWVFGEISTEVFYNSGDSDTPFIRLPGVLIEHGNAAPAAAEKLDNSVFWVDKSRNGHAIVWRADGYQPKRVSNYGIELILSAYPDLSGASGWSYQQNGHTFYCLTPSDTATSTLCLDVATGMWHERTYTNNGALERHRAQNHIFAFGKHLVGDYQDGDFYELSASMLTDDSAVITRRRRAPHTTAEGKRLTVSQLQIDMETGVGPNPALLDGDNNPRQPQAIMRVSKDGGHTWGNQVARDMGMEGEYRQRVRFGRLGGARDFIFELTITDPVRPYIMAAFIEAEVGSD